MKGFLDYLKFVFPPIFEDGEFQPDILVLNIIIGILHLVIIALIVILILGLCGVIDLSSGFSSDTRMMLMPNGSGGLSDILLSRLSAPAAYIECN